MTDPLSPDDKGADDWSFDAGLLDDDWSWIDADCCWCGCDWEDDDEEMSSE